MHRLQLENAQASREAEIAYNGLAAAYREMLSACDDYKAEVDTTQATVDEMEGRLQAVKARVDALKEQRNVFQQREKVLEEDLLHSKADRDAVLEKLVVALEQKKEALESQLEAWKMVDRLRKG
ncbi:hypothetical protein P171DRAFT_433905 [Karstenula rhodostoma CBS 690.94]|uniref:Uncharacterized protein n=1 Tax=Karstenula rhodostoma CBS 690.94 TaxID=1392251 RepID=A0A9P4PE94_9PLEO|nr:hypothetical protein P171DRAFT_433905 [Karstenula rhodostoma CBS 690.94]